MPVGFVGLGAMGSRMASRLLDAGHPVVAYNRSTRRGVDLQRRGAVLVPTPGEVAARARVVCGCLLDGAAVMEVYAGDGGLVAASRPGQIFIEHGTFAPDLARHVAGLLDERGASFLDAPVTGGPDAAASGRLTVMIGGSADAIEQASGVLASYAAVVRRIGGSGSGQQLKLVNQLLVSCHVAAAAEAAALIRRLGIPTDAASEVLNSGWAASAMLERSLGRLRDELLDISEATIGGLVEPQQLVGQLAADKGLSLPLLATASSMFREACAGGMGPMDLAALVRSVETGSAPVI